MNKLKNLWAFLILVWSGIKFRPYMYKINKARKSGDTSREIQLIAECTSGWADYVSDKFDIKYEIIGKENLPDSPCVFISNHQAYFDIMAILYALKGKQTGFIAKNEFKKVPLLGKWILTIRGLLIRRGDVREGLKIIQQGAEYINQGFSMVIFPEGTRSQRREMGAFKPGSFKLATKSKAPVVPIVIDGTYKIFEQKRIISKGETVKIQILPPINTSALDRKELASLSTKIENMIRENLNQSK